MYGIEKRLKELVMRWLPPRWWSHVPAGGIHAREVVGSPPTLVAASNKETIVVDAINRSELGAVVEKWKVL